VILPVVYAVLVWYAAMRFRRQWTGLAVLAVAMLLLAGLNHAMGGEHGRWSGRGANILLILLWPYTALVGGCGLFIFCLPRRPPGEYHCDHCFYDFKGLDPAFLRCPECGRPWNGKGCNPDIPEPELIKPPARRLKRTL